MIEKIKPGDKLTYIKLNDFGTTIIREITVDAIVDGEIIFVHNKKRYSLNCKNDVLILKGHGLGIKQGSWNNEKRWILSSSNYNLGGLNCDTMKLSLKANINEAFDQWKQIYWFDGTSEKGVPLFVSRPVSNNYLNYRQQAEKNNSTGSADIKVGDFIYAYFKGSKHCNLMDMLQTHLKFDEKWNEELQLGKVVEIIDMSEEDFDSLKYIENTDLIKDEGGSYSDDLPEGYNISSLSPFEKETFYIRIALIRTPSGRAILVDRQGYGYMRYTGLLPHYRESMKTDCDRANDLLRIGREKAEKERIQKENERIRLRNEEQTRIEREYSFLTVVTDIYDEKTIANNLRTLLKVKFPAIKFSVKKHRYDYYIVSWEDGPTDQQVTEITGLFKDKGFDGMTDSSYSIVKPFNQRYGAIGYISTDRKISDTVRNQELQLLNKELNKDYSMEDYVAEKGDTVAGLIYRRTSGKDYTPKLPTEIKPLKNDKATVETISVQSLELVDYSDKSFAIIGETKPIKEILKSLGGSFNGRLTCGPGWIFSKSKIDTVKQTLQL